MGTGSYLCANSEGINRNAWGIFWNAWRGVCTSDIVLFLLTGCSLFFLLLLLFKWLVLLVLALTLKEIEFNPQRCFIFDSFYIYHFYCFRNPHLVRPWRTTYDMDPMFQAFTCSIKTTTTTNNSRDSPLYAEWKLTPNTATHPSASPHRSAISHAITSKIAELAMMYMQLRLQVGLSIFRKEASTPMEGGKEYAIFRVLTTDSCVQKSQVIVT